MRFWHGRHLGPLLTVWAVALVLEVALYWTDDRIPALHEMLVPLYYLVALAAMFTTWRWLRARARGHDRRHNDRRRLDRRAHGTAERESSFPE